LIDNYFANGKFEEKIKKLDALISDYVKNDPTAFCTYEQYKTAVSAFITLGNLRAENIQGQLDGTIPSTTEGQNANPDKLISAGNLNLSVLGTMIGGRGLGPMMDGRMSNNINFPAGWGNFLGGMGNFQRGIRETTKMEDEQSDEISQNNQFDEISQNRAPQNQNDVFRNRNGARQNSNAFNRQNNNNNDIPSRLEGGFPVGSPANQGLGFDNFLNNFIILGILLILLIAAIIFAAHFKRSY